MFLYVYMYVYIHTYIYIHIHIYIRICSELNITRKQEYVQRNGNYSRLAAPFFLLACTYCIYTLIYIYIYIYIFMYIYTYIQRVDTYGEFICKNIICMYNPHTGVRAAQRQLLAPRRPRASPRSPFFFVTTLNPKHNTLNPKL